MESNFHNNIENDSSVSCFALDGVVAEMVIEVDDDGESPQKALHLDEIPFKKESESPARQHLEVSDSNQTSTTSTSNVGESSTMSKAMPELSIEKEHHSDVSECKSLPDNVALAESSASNKSIARPNDNMEVNNLNRRIFSSAEQVRAAARLIGESKNEILKVAKLIQESNEKNVDDSSASNPVTLSDFNAIEHNETSLTESPEPWNIETLPMPSNQELDESLSFELESSLTKKNESHSKLITEKESKTLIEEVLINDSKSIAEKKTKSLADDSRESEEKSEAENIKVVKSVDSKPLSKKTRSSFNDHPKIEVKFKHLNIKDAKVVIENSKTVVEKITKRESKAKSKTENVKLNSKDSDSVDSKSMSKKTTKNLFDDHPKIEVKFKSVNNKEANVSIENSKSSAEKKTTSSYSNSHKLDAKSKLESMKKVKVSKSNSEKKTKVSQNDTSKIENKSKYENMKEKAEVSPADSRKIHRRKTSTPVKLKDMELAEEENSTSQRISSKSKTESALEIKNLENFMPTAVSTRGNKRKLVELENDSDPKKKSSELPKSERNRHESSTYSKPKPYNYFEKDSRFEKFYAFKSVYNEADLKYQRQFYRVLFDKWAPNDVHEMKKEVFQFSGFPFSKNSEEVLKRKHILNKLPDASIIKICEMLGLSAVSKRNDKVIGEILKFLLKPTKLILCVVDPLKNSMQPIVKVKKLSLEHERLKKTDEKSLATPVQVKPIQVRPVGRPRKSLPKVETTKETLKMESLEKNSASPAKRKLSVKIDSPLPLKKKAVATKDSDNAPTPPKRVAVDVPLTPASKKTIPSSETKPLSSSKKKESTVKAVEKKSDAEMLDLSFLDSIPTFKKEKIPSKDNKMASTSNSSDENSSSKKFNKENKKLSHKDIMHKRINKLKKEISDLKVKVDKTIIKAKGTTTAIESTSTTLTKTEVIEQEKISDDSRDLPSLEDREASSDITLSAEESSDEPVKKVLKKKTAPLGNKPLRSYTNILESIKNGSFSSLQRLHIVLFGASDKPENLKANILAFCGFPFLEGSNEWKQKEFLLSLLSHNTLKEYMDLLCMDHEGEDQQTMISNLMKFLAQPKGKEDPKDDEVLMEEAPGDETPPLPTNSLSSVKTKIIRSEIVQPPAQQAKGPVKKKVKKVEKKATGTRHRKVLMDEAQVRRLEADIAREQRIREREKRLREQKALKNLTTTQSSVSKTTAYNRPIPVGKTPLAVKSSLLTNIQRKPGEGSPKMPISSEYRGIPVGTFMKLPASKSISRTPTQTLVIPQISDSLPSPSPPVVKQTDAEQLNALLQTVYKRRALKAAGASISSPNKGTSTKLGELPNVKFLVVTANFSDLDVLHHLIYMTDCTKSKVRKNILDFAGFGFNEDSHFYKERINFLNTLGYDISKRIAFLLGLCPFKIDIDKEDLNELIMYFLMSPCKTKQVPITHLPQTFFSTNMPKELCMLMQKHGDLEISVSEPNSNLNETTPENSISQSKTSTPKRPRSPTTPVVARSSVKSPSISSSTPTSVGPKAKKSFKSSCLSSATKKPASSPSTSTTPYKSFNPVIKQPTSTLKKAVLQPPPPQPALTPQPPLSPQEFLIQQQTPDGKQKTYKIIKLPTGHPLPSALKQQQPLQLQQPVQLPPIIQPLPVSFNTTLSTLPPGIIIFKNKNDPPLNLTSALPNMPISVPIVLGPQASTPFMLSQPVTNVVTSTEAVVSPVETIVTRPETILSPETVVSPPETVVSPPEKKQVEPPRKPDLPVVQIDDEDDDSEFDDDSDEEDEDDIEVISTIKHKPPTDQELFLSIQKVINNSNFEDMTLRNVIDQVCAKYPDFDLTSRRGYMKECVKKIIVRS